MIGATRTLGGRAIAESLHGARVGKTIDVRKLALALCLAALATPASARNAEDYWCGTPRIHLMMWIAKVQVWARDDEGKLIRDKDGNLVSGGFGGETYEQYGIINHK
jgi:hypothetical protein